MEVRGLTVGPLAENTWILRGEGGALVVDPGEEAPRILEALGDTPVAAILLTHCHFDHVGAVAPVARATGAPVWCPVIEVEVLADVMRYVPWPGIGPYESYAADHTLAGGERLTLAGIELDVLATPGHSPGHLSFSIPAERVLVSGDVLFALFQFIGPDTSIAQSAFMSVLAMTIYVPLGYVMDRAVYNRRQKSKARA